jgi:tRNA threonylcarbamoyladenosine biosynthesis protein TsaB
MTILGFDTCTETVDVALVRDGRTLSCRRGTAPRRQLTRLMPFVAEVMEEASCRVGDLHLIAVTTGPGSFTGIRLGITTARTLAQMLRLPVSPVDTIRAVAAGCPRDGLVLASLDARKGEVFFALYQKRGDGLKLLDGNRKASLAEYVEYVNGLEPRDGEELVITGSVLGRYGEILEREIRVPFARPHPQHWTPSGSVVAALGEEMARDGKTLDYLHLTPDYMRDFEAVPPAPLV